MFQSRKRESRQVSCDFTFSCCFRGQWHRGAAHWEGNMRNCPNVQVCPLLHRSGCLSVTATAMFESRKQKCQFDFPLFIPCTPWHSPHRHQLPYPRLWEVRSDHFSRLRLWFLGHSWDNVTFNYGSPIPRRGMQYCTGRGINKWFTGRDRLRGTSPTGATVSGTPTPPNRPPQEPSHCPCRGPHHV
uniref:Uncharacterized protein n=1 Tax=Xenopus tropicalis TaxID=8364 RepID=A0A1B8XVU4_XENTR